MKIGKYIYVINNGNETYWFNGVNQRYFIVDKGLSDKLKFLLRNENGVTILQRNSPLFYTKMKEEGFLLEDNIDELDIIRQNHKKAADSKDYFLIILPTLNCNYRCWYCVQDHIVSCMDDVTITKVKAHIERMIKKEGITSLHLEWFGGEPLMFFNKVIQPISEFAIELCDKSSVPFWNSATTNGYFMTKRIRERLVQLRFKLFQITLDGKREVHNKVKNTIDKKQSTFDVTLNNIDELLSIEKDVKILLRINYGAQTLDTDIIQQINSIIKSENRSSIYLFLRKVWQEKVDSNRTTLIKDLTEEFRRNGYSVEESNLIFGIPCYSDKKYYNAINYNGEVVKCTACDDLYKNAPGKLMDDGSIYWRKGFLKKFYRPRFENGHCLKCKYLPICMGHCGRDYDKTSTAFVCKHEWDDLSFEETIKMYIINKELANETI